VSERMPSGCFPTIPQMFRDCESWILPIRPTQRWLAALRRAKCT
jgi:hypothetical protein